MTIMTINTINNGESASNVRQKINDTINQTNINTNEINGLISNNIICGSVSPDNPAVLPWTPKFCLFIRNSFGSDYSAGIQTTNKSSINIGGIASSNGATIGYTDNVIKVSSIYTCQYIAFK